MRTRTTPSNLFLAFLLGGLGVLVLHMTVGLGGHGADGLIDDGVYNVLMFGAAFAVIARGDRVQGAARGVADDGRGAALLEPRRTLFHAVRRRLRRGRRQRLSGGCALPGDVPLPVRGARCCCWGRTCASCASSMWLDGLIGGLAAATLAAAVVLPPIIDHAHGDVASVAVALAYPIGDLLLLIFTIGALGMTGWRPGRVWLLIAASMLLNAIADSTYLYQTATSTYRAGTWVEACGPPRRSCWRSPPGRRGRRRSAGGWRTGGWCRCPAISLLTALGVFIYGNLHHQLTLAALILATATVLAVSARLMLTVRENLAMLVGSRRLALTDPLTGLGNRRQLMEDLELACRLAAEQRAVAAGAVRPERLQALQRHLRPSRGRRPAGAAERQAERESSPRTAPPTGWEATSSAS